MPTPSRSSISRPISLLLILSGWTVAAWLGTRTPEPAPLPPIVVSPAPRESKMESAFREWRSNPKLDGTAIGFCLLDEKGQPLFASPLAATALCPASSFKTLTTGAALNLLGLDFRFETTLAGTAPIDAMGTLAGDLILIGSGDPTFSQDDLAALADAVVAAGLKSVTGRLIVDASIFPQDPMSEHWAWGDIGNGYGAGAFGLNLDHNRFPVRFEPGAQVGAPAALLDPLPVTHDTQSTNYVTTGPEGSGDQVVIYSEPYGRTITLRGTVPLGQSGFTVTAADPDPPAHAAELLRARLEAAGVKFAANPGPASSSARTTLARRQSIPLPEIVDHLHRVSDNLEAQCLFLTLGNKQKTEPAKASRQYWENAGVPFVNLRLIDGNGLARANVIRPLDLARVNFAARHSPAGDRFHQSLSTYLNGNVHAKIGSMSGVKTQVGFLRTAQGREFTFAMMANGLGPGREFWELHEALLETARTMEW